MNIARLIKALSTCDPDGEIFIQMEKSGNDFDAIGVLDSDRTITDLIPVDCHEEKGCDGGHAIK